MTLLMHHARRAAFAAVLIVVTGASAFAQDVVRLPMHGFSIGPYFEYICPTPPNTTGGKPSRGLLRGIRGYAGVWVDSLHTLCGQLFEFQTVSMTPTRFTRGGPLNEGFVVGKRDREVNKNATCSDTMRIIGVRTNNYRHDSTLAWIQPVCSAESSAGPDLERLRKHDVVTPLAGSGEKGPDDWEYCPLGMVAVGVRGHADHSVRMFGLLCARPDAAPRTLGRRQR